MNPAQRFDSMLTAMMGWEAVEHYGWLELVEWQCANAPEPEPPYDGPEQPEDWDEDDFAHYDTPGGW